VNRRTWTRACTAVLATSLLLLSACGDTDDTADSGSSGSTTTEATGPSVAFASPANGASVSNPVAVTFATHDFTLEPAGEVHEHAGHLHVMVDVPCVTPGQPIPKDAQHLHFGKGQTEAKIDLQAGEHTLCLQAGDGAHTALDLTDTITVTVDDTPSVAITEPAADATVTSPVAVKLAAYNFTVEPAGEVHPDAGHLHVMVDVPCVDPGQVIPKDDQHVHLGQGQTEASLPLAPGQHTLCVQAGDGAHTALPVTRTVTFTVSG
jgi:hypothetical protein